MIFAVGVVLYNPSIEDLKKIQIYASVFDKVFIFDNSDEMVDIPSYSNCVILGRDGNKGISVALNKITEKALENNIDYLCTMDQDSNFREEDIKKMKKTINQGDNNIAIYSPIVVYDNHAKKNIDGDLSEVNWVITSGSFVNLRLVEKLGIKYDEAYFIDRVDKDYCAQINKTGYKIMRVNHCYLYQQLGDGNNSIHSNHSVQRHYYIFRNRFYFNNKFSKGVKSFLLTTAQTIKHVMLIIMYENKKIEKINILKKAFIDYKCGKMGAKNNEN